MYVYGIEFYVKFRSKFYCITFSSVRVSTPLSSCFCRWYTGTEPFLDADSLSGIVTGPSCNNNTHNSAQRTIGVGRQATIYRALSRDP